MKSLKIGIFCSVLVAFPAVAGGGHGRVRQLDGQVALDRLKLSVGTGGPTELVAGCRKDAATIST